MSDSAFTPSIDPQILKAELIKLVNGEPSQIEIIGVVHKSDADESGVCMFTQEMTYQGQTLILTYLLNPLLESSTLTIQSIRPSHAHTA